MGTLASAYSHTGHPRRAVALLVQSIAVWEKSGSKETRIQSLTTELSHIANQQIMLGELTAAEENLHRGLCYARRSNYDAFREIGEAGYHEKLAQLAAYRGAFDVARREVHK